MADIALAELAKALRRVGVDAEVRAVSGDLPPLCVVVTAHDVRLSVEQRVGITESLIRKFAGTRMDGVPIIVTDESISVAVYQRQP